MLHIETCKSKEQKNFWCIRTRHPGIAWALFEIPKFSEKKTLPYVHICGQCPQNASAKKNVPHHAYVHHVNSFSGRCIICCGTQPHEQTLTLNG